MAMPQTMTATRHAYANREFKRMLIDGQWVEAASGKTLREPNPATGDAASDGRRGRCRRHQPGRGGGPARL